MLIFLDLIGAYGVHSVDLGIGETKVRPAPAGSNDAGDDTIALSKRRKRDAKYHHHRRNGKKRQQGEDGPDESADGGTGGGDGAPSDQQQSRKRRAIKNVKNDSRSVARPCNHQNQHGQQGENENPDNQEDQEVSRNKREAGKSVRKGPNRRGKLPEQQEGGGNRGGDDTSTDRRGTRKRRHTSNTNKRNRERKSVGFEPIIKLLTPESFRNKREVEGFDTENLPSEQKSFFKRISDAWKQVSNEVMQLVKNVQQQFQQNGYENGSNITDSDY